METIAVYWEPRIKTYGLNTLNNLSLFEFYYPEEKIIVLGKILSSDNFQGIKTKIHDSTKAEGWSFTSFLSFRKRWGEFSCLLEKRFNLKAL